VAQSAGPFRPRRRTVITAALAAPLVRLLAVSPASAGGSRVLQGASSYRFLTAHHADVVIEATARLVPGPVDDPAEIGHPGAREAGVVHYVDRLLSVFDDGPPHVFAGGPWSDRHAAGPDHLADFVPLLERQRRAWRRRVAQLRRRMTSSIVELDKAAVGYGFSDFVAAPTPVQDRILTEQSEARDVLFSMTIDAMYSVPEYGGNAGLSAWQEIKWQGDRQPVGYPAAAVEADDGPDPVASADRSAVRELIAALPILTRARSSRRARRG
jgi:gluconate 2-dehydrogenase gamma chain